VATHALNGLDIVLIALALGACWKLLQRR